MTCKRSLWDDSRELKERERERSLGMRLGEGREWGLVMRLGEGSGNVAGMDTGNEYQIGLKLLSHDATCIA